MIEVLTAVATALLVSGAAQAAGNNYTGSGNMSIVWSGGSVAVGFNPTTNSSHGACVPPPAPYNPQWVQGDTFTFTDSWSVDNSLNGGPLQVAFQLELYEWVHGAAGPLISSDSIGLAGTPSWPYSVPAHSTASGTLTVAGQYNSWNGSPACELSFHVYRHAGSPNANNANSNWY